MERSVAAADLFLACERRDGLTGGVDLAEIGVGRRDSSLGGLPPEIGTPSAGMTIFASRGRSFATGLKPVADPPRLGAVSPPSEVHCPPSGLPAGPAATGL